MKTTVLFMFVLSICHVVEQQTAAQQPVASNPAATKPNEPSPAAAGNLDVQIGETLVRLTRARLDLATRLNAQAPRTVPPDEIAILNEKLQAIDEQQRRGEVTDWFSTLIGIAEISSATAKADWQRSSMLQQQFPGTISELDVEILRLRAQLAELTLQRGKLAATQTANDRQNWAFLYLSVQMQALSDRVRLLEQRK
jgi:hypothetical protein